MDDTLTEADDLPLAAADMLANSLAKRLTLRPEEETDGPKLKSKDFDQSYQWICKELRQSFSQGRAEKVRMGISDIEYWEREARHYRDAANEQIWQNALSKYSQRHMPATAEAWRCIAKFYQGVLIENGLPLQQAKDVRLSIDAEKYWQLEARFYQRSPELVFASKFSQLVQALARDRAEPPLARWNYLRASEETSTKKIVIHVCEYSLCQQVQPTCAGTGSRLGRAAPGPMESTRL
ncbi:hypothetical protein DV735_g1701, partial [Chaetothyriales sp. CBS 134920]